MVTTSIVFDHRGRTKKNSEGPLEVRVTVDRRSYYVSTGIKVRASEWKFGAIANRADMAELNERLNVIAGAVEREVTACIKEQRPVDVPDIRRKVFSVRQDREGAAPFLDWFEAQLPGLALSPGTARHYTTVLARLRACTIIRKWSDLTVENIYRLDTWLHTLTIRQNDAQRKMGIPPTPIGDAAVFTYHKILKAMISRAVRMELIDSNPYTRMRGELKRGVKESVEYLTDEEVAAIKALQLDEGSLMAAARDLFIFQTYTGMSYSDAQRFDISKYKRVNGKWVSISQRVKTGVPYVGQLLPPVIKVLERYNWQVPQINNAKYNNLLKVIGADAGIKTPLHSHLARHTFATWMLRNGVSIENLARMLGHTKLEQTMRYAKVVAQSVHDDFDRVAAILEEKEGSHD